ncbi:uncharacterized protein G2W53_001041 [Senna tora]|uniref:Uncharacterized protein n=1 Tax=Senna tora TaxID=362788 RepID=A0A835CI96_9FABA|nr:uncharacterized protein G2W53_001041 [Senna tora]
MARNLTIRSSGVLMDLMILKTLWGQLSGRRGGVLELINRALDH